MPTAGRSDRWAEGLWSWPPTGSSRVTIWVKDGQLPHRQPHAWGLVAHAMGKEF